MKRKRLWIIISIVGTLGWLGGGTTLVWSLKEAESGERARRLVNSCLLAPYVGVSWDERSDFCVEPNRRNERGFQARLTESALVAGLSAGAFWALFAFVFFGSRRSRRGRDEPEAVA